LLILSAILMSLAPGLSLGAAAISIAFRSAFGSDLSPVSSQNEGGDIRSEFAADPRCGYSLVLDGVVKQSSTDHVLGGASSRHQVSDLQQVVDVWLAVSALAALFGVPL